MEEDKYGGDFSKLANEHWSVPEKRARDMLSDFKKLTGVSVEVPIIYHGDTRDSGLIMLCSKETRLVKDELPYSLYSYVKDYIKIHKKHCLI